jgi:hypothetical protein
MSRGLSLPGYCSPAFDTSVKHIIAQPFLLSAQVDAAIRRYVPDFLLLSASSVSQPDSYRQR